MKIWQHYLLALKLFVTAASRNGALTKCFELSRSTRGRERVEARTKAGIDGEANKYARKSALQGELTPPTCHRCQIPARYDTVISLFPNTDTGLVTSVENTVHAEHANQVHHLAGKVGRGRTDDLFRVPGERGWSCGG